MASLTQTSFLDTLISYPPSVIEHRLSKIRPHDVERALRNAGAGNLDDFLALISPVAVSYLGEMAHLSTELTRKRFGKTIKFFVPIYLSNECQNICTYCGFSYTNPTPRLTLTREEILKEIQALKNYGFDRVLILTGENHKHVGIEFFKEMIPLFKEYFSEVAIEVQPLTEQEYADLRSLGLDGVTVYQETYHQELYKIYHPRGKKSNFSYRLDTPERAGHTGIHKLGIGALLGLAPWRLDSFYTALHYLFLKKRFWTCEFSISFPRIRPAEDVNVKNHYANTERFPSEQELAQLIFAYRLLDEDVGLSLSTRERQVFRDSIIPLGITNISAGSITNPGGYACYPAQSLEQFEIEDARSPQQMTDYLRNQGLDPVFKDWMRELSS